MQPSRLTAASGKVPEAKRPNVKAWRGPTHDAVPNRQLLSRRRFLKSGASAAAFTSAISLTRCSSIAPAPSPRTLPLDRLRSAIQGSVIVPSDPAYGIASQPWNAHFAGILPAAVVVVASADDVAQTIKFAREYRFSFAM